MNTRLYLKHWMSCLKDQVIDVSVDESRREVLLTVQVFDSHLIGTAVTAILPERFGVVAYRDDAIVDDATWITRPSSYSLSIAVGGMTFRGQVVRLSATPVVAVTLEPMGDRHG